MPLDGRRASGGPHACRTMTSRHVARPASQKLSSSGCAKLKRTVARGIEREHSTPPQWEDRAAAPHTAPGLLGARLGAPQFAEAAERPTGAHRRKAGAEHFRIRKQPIVANHVGEQSSVGVARLAVGLETDVAVEHQ